MTELFWPEVGEAVEGNRVYVEYQGKLGAGFLRAMSL